MPVIRTIFRPWETHEVSDAEAASLAAMGHIAPEPAEEVNSSGSEEADAEEGGGEAASGLQGGDEQDRPQGGRKPRRRTANPRVPDPQDQPSSEAGQPEPEEGPTEEEGEVTA